MYILKVPIPKESGMIIIDRDNKDQYVFGTEEQASRFPNVTVEHIFEHFMKDETQEILTYNEKTLWVEKVMRDVFGDSWKTYLPGQRPNGIKCY